MEVEAPGLRRRLLRILLCSVLLLCCLESALSQPRPSFTSSASYRHRGVLQQARAQVLPRLAQRSAQFLHRGAILRLTRGSSEGCCCGPASPTPTQTWTPVGTTATATRTVSPGGPTATRSRTSTPAGPTATPTRTVTPGGPTATRTRTVTPGGPTATPTRTVTPRSPTATATVTTVGIPIHSGPAPLILLISLMLAAAAAGRISQRGANR